MAHSRYMDYADDTATVERKDTVLVQKDELDFQELLAKKTATSTFSGATGGAVLGSAVGLIGAIVGAFSGAVASGFITYFSEKNRQKAILANAHRNTSSHNRNSPRKDTSHLGKRKRR